MSFIKIKLNETKALADLYIKEGVVTTIYYEDEN